MAGGRPVAGFNTPSRKLELYSPTLHEWKWPDNALPEYIPSHVGPEALAAASGATDRWPAGVPPVVWPPHARGEVLALLPIYRSADPHPLA